MKTPFTYFLSAIPVFTLACGPSASSDAGSLGDSGSANAPGDAAADVGSDRDASCPAGDLAVTLVVPQSETLASCGTLINGLQLEYIMVDRYGSCSPVGTNAYAVLPSGDRISLGAPANLFATVGSTSAGLGVERACTSPSTGPCTYQSNSFACQFTVTQAGGVGDRVAADLASPCLVYPVGTTDAGPITVSALHVEGTLVQWIVPATTTDDGGVDAFCQ